MLQSWQHLVNRQILPSTLKRYKLIYRDSEIFTENCFPLIDKHLQLWGFFFSQEKPHLESVLKLALLQDEIMKLAKSVFLLPHSLCYCSQCGISSFGQPLVLLTFGYPLLPLDLSRNCLIPSMLYEFLVNIQFLLTY